MSLRRVTSLLSFALLTGCTVLSGVASLEVGADETSEGAQTASSSSSGSIDGGADVYTKNTGARSDPPEENPPPPSSSSSSSSSGAVPDAGGVNPIVDASGTPPPPPPPATPITQTFMLTLQEDARFQYGPFNAKAGTMVEATTTGSGDPDIYLNFGGPATFGNADCSSEGPDADERCRRTTPSPASPAYVMVYAWGETTTYTLRVTYTPGP